MDGTGSGAALTPMHVLQRQITRSMRWLTWFCDCIIDVRPVQAAHAGRWAPGA